MPNKIEQITVDGVVYDIKDRELAAEVEELKNIIPSVEQLSYEVSADGDYYIVTGKGTVKGSEIIIPDIYEGKPVKEVGVKAFNEDETITKITVGKYITYVGGGAFNCPNLTELYFTMTPNIMAEALGYSNVEELPEWAGYHLDCELCGRISGEGSLYVWQVTDGAVNVASSFKMLLADGCECYGCSETECTDIEAENLAMSLAEYA